MAERKVLNKYFPPDFDPSKIPRRKIEKEAQQKVRLMTPFSMRCSTCGEYIGKGKKFNVCFLISIFVIVSINSNLSTSIQTGPKRNGTRTRIPRSQDLSFLHPLSTLCRRNHIQNRSPKHGLYCRERGCTKL